MIVEVKEKSDNLSEISIELKRVEDTYIHSGSTELAHARNAVVGSISGFKVSRLNLGRALRTYKQYFKAERDWTSAMKIIADVLQCDERTVYRLIEDYERASRLPEITLEAMAGQKIDPAAAKNAPVVENLLRMPEPKTHEEATKAVVAVHQKHVAERKQQDKESATNPATTEIEVFAKRILKQFEDRYRSMAPAQRDAEARYVLELVANTLRLDIRELRQYSRPAQVPKPTVKEAA